MDRGSWQAIVHGVAKHWTRLNDQHFHKICFLKPCSIFFWRRQWHPTPVLLLGKPHGWKSLVGCSPWGRWGSDTTEWLHFHFSLSCHGEENGNPLQCSCLENPRDGGAWWAAVYGVAQSRTRLKWLSRSSRAILRGAQVSVDQELAITVSWEDIVLPGFTRLFMFSDHFYFLSAMEKSIWVSLAITGSWEDS